MSLSGHVQVVIGDKVKFWAVDISQVNISISSRFLEIRSKRLVLMVTECLEPCELWTVFGNVPRRIFSIVIFAP